MSDVRKESAFGSAEDRSGQILRHPVHQESPSRQLQDQLESLLFQSEDDEIDSEALVELLERLDEASPLPVELDVEKSLESFHRQYSSVFDAVRIEKDSEETVPIRKRRSWLWVGKLVVVAAALTLLLCTTAQAMGLDVFSAIARWTSEIFGLGGYSASFASVQNNPLNEGEKLDFDSLEEAVAAFGIEAPLVPKEIPERFELISVKAASNAAGILIYADYLCEDGFLHITYREASEENRDSVEKEYGEVSPYIVRGIKHYLSSDLQRRKALWVNGDFECRFNGTISEQELMDMINSIY